MKKELKVEQLVKDGFVQLKTLRQLQKQGILPKEHIINQPFRNTKSVIFIVNSMYNLLGKVVPVERLTTDGLGIRAADWAWPLEAIQC